MEERTGPDDARYLDLTEAEKSPVIAENWPVTGQPVTEENDDSQKIGKGNDQPLHIDPDADADAQGKPESFLPTDPADLKAVFRVADNKEVTLKTQDGHEVFEEAREKQRERIAQLRATHTEEERDAP